MSACFAELFLSQIEKLLNCYWLRIFPKLKDVFFLFTAGSTLESFMSIIYNILLYDYKPIAI